MGIEDVTYFLNGENNGTTFTSNDTWEYIKFHRGMQQQPLEMAIPLTVVNVLIFTSGLLGNLAVCIVIIKHPSLHTATNYYLFNLAVSDLTLLIFGLPNDVAIYWHQYPWTLGESFCRVRALLSETASYVSVLTVVAFSTERYLAICHPLYLHTMSGLQRAIRIITLLWVLAFLCALPFSIYTEIDYLYFPPNSSHILLDSAYCGMTSPPEGIPLLEISTLVFFVVPMLLLTVQYTKMALRISQTARKTLMKGLKGSVHRDSRRTQSNRAVIRMLSAVVIGFFGCWAPFHAQRLLVIYAQDHEFFPEVHTWMFVITGIFYYFSSTLNPILYNVMSERMRNAFKEVICGIKSTKNIKRGSTFREHSRSCHFNLEKTTQENVEISIADDAANLVNNDSINLSSKMNSTLIYEIRYNNPFKNSKYETDL